MTIDNENKTQLRDELLATLSFFEDMTLEKIFLDINQEYVQKHHELKVEDLRFALEQLKKEGLVKEKKQNKELSWIRVYPRKPNIFQRFIKLFTK